MIDYKWQKKEDSDWQSKSVYNTVRDRYGYLPQDEPTIVGFWQDQNHSLSLASFRRILSKS